MDTNYANAGGGMVGAAATAPGRYNAALNCQRGVTYNAYDPYGGSNTGVRPSSVYPYDAEAEFKERTGMGKTKAVANHNFMAGNMPTSGLKIQQNSYNLANSCYSGSYNQVGVQENANYYAYAYDQQQLYPQQQQPQYHQNQLQQQYKYSVKTQQPQAPHPHTHRLHQQQQQQQQQPQQQQQNAVPSMKMSPPEFGYAPYHHPYYHPHYHHPGTQKGGVLKQIPDASSIPYVNGKMLHSAAMGSRALQYPSNYAYHPAHSYPQHTYQGQSACDDSRWMWNGSEYQASCRSAYPGAGGYVNSSGATVKQQAVMWPMQYQNTSYPTPGAANQSCCPSIQSAGAATYYPQQYVKYPDYTNSSNDLYSAAQVNQNSVKVYTDLSVQQQSTVAAAPNAYQPQSVSYHQQPSGDYSLPATYLQEQQTESPSASSTSSTSSYNHHYYNPYPHQSYATAEPQEELYTQQQVDSKIGLTATTKGQSLRDFLTSWNEDEDEPFMEQLHLAAADHFTNQTPPEGPIMENHLQFKGSFSSRPKIHVGITVDSTVEADQYINLPDIIIDIEKSNKDVVNTIPEEIIVTKIEKEEDVRVPEIPANEEKEPSTQSPIAEAAQPLKKLNDLRSREKRKFRRKFSRCKRIPHQQKLRLIQRNQRKLKVPRKLQLLRPKSRRVKKQFRIERLQELTVKQQQQQQLYNPQSLKCLCVSLINSDKFRNRILGPSEIDNLINHLTTVDSSSEVTIALATATATSASASSVVIPKLSDLCKNALNSSFDRDVLVINLDEILDSDNLFVVQCDINENILENYQQQLQQQQQQQQQENEQQQQQDELVEILNDNNNNFNLTTNEAHIQVVTTPQSPTTETETVRTIEELNRRSCSVTEVSNLPLDNAVEHNNNLNLTSQPLVQPSSTCCSSPSSSPLFGFSSSSCPAALFTSPASDSPKATAAVAAASSSPSLLIEQNCPIEPSEQQQITVRHEQLQEMLILSAIGENNDDDGDHHHLIHHDSNDSELLAATTPSTIHHEEIVPENLKKFQNEKFLKYLHAKYVQGNLSEFYHANRIIKKYKKRIIKKILNIVR